MLYEEQNIQWKHYINVLKLLKVYNATLFASGLTLSLFKSEYLTGQHQQKNLRTNQNVFY